MQRFGGGAAGRGSSEGRGGSRGGGDDANGDGDGDDDGGYRVRCPGGCDDPTSLVVLRPKPHFAGISWPALVEASGGRAQEIAEKGSR